MSEAFPHAEVGLAKKMGVRRTVLRTLRASLKKGEDFEVIGKSVQWSEKAAEQAALTLGIALPTLSEKRVPDSPVNEEPASSERFTVIRRTLNPHLVLCQNADRMLEWVRVPHNRNFTPGLVFNAKKSGAAWELVGRCPRWPGRW